MYDLDFFLNLVIILFKSTHKVFITTLTPAFQEEALPQIQKQEIIYR